MHIKLTNSQNRYQNMYAKFTHICGKNMDSPQRRVPNTILLFTTNAKWSSGL